MLKQMTVTGIYEEKDRKTLYGHPTWPDYHVIAPRDLAINIGDVVEYDPEGFNFGWFKRIVAKEKNTHA